jgi:3-isopropylmalate dehydrogenase
LRLSDGLFLKEVRAVAKQYPDVELDEKIVDAMAALLVRNPDKFDCIVTGNMFGDILSDEASELSGGLGIAASTMTGDTACCAQAQHGSAPDIAGQDKANPVSLILSAAMLLEWLAVKHSRPEFDTAAKAIEAAIDAALQSPETRTVDLGGKLGTKAFTAKLVAAI